MVLKVYERLFLCGILFFLIVICLQCSKAEQREQRRTEQEHFLSLQRLMDENKKKFQTNLLPERSSFVKAPKNHARHELEYHRIEKNSSSPTSDISKRGHSSRWNDRASGEETNTSSPDEGNPPAISEGKGNDVDKWNGELHINNEFNIFDAANSVSQEDYEDHYYDSEYHDNDDHYDHKSADIPDFSGRVDTVPSSFLDYPDNVDPSVSEREFTSNEPASDSSSPSIEEIVNASSLRKTPGTLIKTGRSRAEAEQNPRDFYLDQKRRKRVSRAKASLEKRYDETKPVSKKPSASMGHPAVNDVVRGGGGFDDNFGEDSGALYTQWSKWSRCSKHCQQSRRRRCRVPSLCGTALVKERRPCAGWRCQHEKFHLIKPDEVAHRFRKNDELKPPPRADVRVLLNYNSMFYTRWSEWASCSRTCLTSRFRSCRYSLFCGNAVIREEAYCYTQDSACEKWYKRHKLDSDSNKMDAMDRNYNKVTPLTHEFIQHNQSLSQTLRPPSGIEEQVVFGRNQYLTENAFAGDSFFLPSPEKPIPERSPEKSRPEILMFQIEGNPHRFGLVKEKPEKPKKTISNSVIDDSSFDSIKDYKFDKNGYGVSHYEEGVHSLIGESPTKDSFFFKESNYMNNVENLPTHSSKQYSRGDSALSRHHLQLQSIGKHNVLPKKCGASRVPKPPWTLKIIGGQEAPPDKWPWQVAILNRFKEVFCGGTLIASQWIVTAAHCLRKRLFVRLAEHDLAIKEGPELEYKITDTVAHPLYDSTTVDNDVALLRLPEPVQNGVKISPACIPEQGAPLPVGKECTITGWGKERNTHFFGTDVLNEAEVPIISDATCRRVYSDYYITKNMFCAGYLRGRVDSCAGDSGGPLLCHTNGLWYIYGITSFGEGCGREGKFGIYANVANYRTWINGVMAAHAHRVKYGKSLNSTTYRQKRHRRRHAKYDSWFRRRAKNQFQRLKNSTRKNSPKFSNRF